MKIQCPYCLMTTEQKMSGKNGRRVYVCQECESELHRNLFEKTMAKRSTIGLVGFSGHGKTVYITALFYTLRNLIRKGVWPKRFSQLPLDNNTNQVLCENVPKLEKAALPDGTSQNFPQPAVIQFNKLPAYGDRMVTFYDVAGGVYEHPDRITDAGRFVGSSDVVFFLIDLDKCGDDLANSTEKLLNTYIQAVYNDLHININKSQHLVVILSKADKIATLPLYLKEQLHGGNYERYRFSSADTAAADMRLHISRIEAVSETIRKWLVGLDCGGFCNLAANSFKTVSYVVVSATGSEPINKTSLAAPLQPNDPKCVLDPFFIAMERTGRPNIFGFIKSVINAPKAMLFSL